MANPSKASSQYALRCGCLYSIHALGWVKPYFGVPQAWVKAARAILATKKAQSIRAVAPPKVLT